MKKEYFIGDKRKYGVTLMETVRLDERLPHKDIYTVKWTTLTHYKGLYIQTFPMVRMDGEFYDFTPIKKTEYDQIMAMLKQTSEDLQPLLVVKREIDGKICVAEKNVWDIVNQAKENEV